MQESFQTECDCSHPLYGEANNDIESRPCQLSDDGEDRECINDIITEYDVGERECDCTTSCNEFDFEKLVSSTVWPGDQFVPVIKKDYGISEAKVKRNLLRIDVYFMSLNVKFIRESPRYTLFSFLSVLGGAFGIWIGLSVVIIFEVLEFILDVVINIVRR